MYSGEYDACDVTLSVYPHRTSLKNMPGHGGIPKVVGSIPTVAGHIFQARPVWIYTQSNITSIIMRYSGHWIATGCDCNCYANAKFPMAFTLSEQMLIVSCIMEQS